MDFFTIFMQVFSVVIGSISQVFFEKFCNKKFDRKTMCRLYLAQEDNSVKQSNEITDSFNGNNINGNLTVQQQNINNVNINNGSNNTSSQEDGIDDTIKAFALWAAVFIVCILFSSFMVYLKKDLYFDYWYLLVVVAFSIVTSVAYYFAMKKNNELYWNLYNFKSSLFLILAFSITLNLSIDFPESVKQFEEILMSKIVDFDSVINIATLVEFSNYNVELIYLTLRYSMLVLPLVILLMETYYLFKKNESCFILQNYILFVYGLLYFGSFFIYTLASK